MEQGALTLFAGLQRINFLLCLEFLICVSRDEEEGECIAHFRVDYKKVDLQEALKNEGDMRLNRASISFLRLIVFTTSLPQSLC